MSKELRLSPAQYNVLNAAAVRHLTRTTGGWRAKSGDLITMRQANSLLHHKLLAMVHRPRWGACLVLTAEGRKLADEWAAARRYIPSFARAG